MPNKNSFDKALKRLLQRWHSPTLQENPLAELFQYRRDLLRQNHSPKQLNNRLINEGLNALLQTHPQYSDLLRLRFIENKSPQRVASILNISESHCYRLQGLALAELSAIVVNIDQKEQSDHCDQLEKRLVAPVDQNLLGLEQPLAILQPLLIQRAEPWLIAIEGIGGVGKTALAHRLMQTLIAGPLLWDGLAWVTCAPTYFDPHGIIRPMENPALTQEALLSQLYDQLLPGLPKPASCADESAIETLVQQIKRRNCLIVIDNLETLPAVERLLPILRRLSNPSKVVLTSHENRFAEPDLAHYVVSELSAEHALQLLRRPVTLQPAPTAYHDEELLPIYEATGGNPLALLLIAGQLQMYSLEIVLADLRLARGESIQNLYTFIYRHAWDRLDRAARKVLLLMPLVSGLADPFDLITQQAELDPSTVRTSFSQLLMLNLVQVLSVGRQRSYTLHNLTRTFLLEQGIQWQKVTTNPTLALP